MVKNNQKEVAIKAEYMGFNSIGVALFPKIGI